MFLQPVYTHIMNSFFQNELNIVPDGSISLDTFCDFQQTLNTPSETDPLHHDYAIMITRFVITK